MELSVMEEKLEGQTSAFTKDTQHVEVHYAVTYSPDSSKIHLLYQKFGRNWEDKIIKPAILGSLKDVVGQYVADDLVSKREAAKSAIFNELQEQLLKRDVTLTRIDLTNLDFDQAYESAVESKVVAVQKAAEAKNKTVQVEEEAKQSVKRAEAEAQSMRIRSQALSQNKSLVEYEAVQKWNGVLPTYVVGGNSVPFINLDKK
jgi:regulator of protease activity HflC (stomatin/prohibitin superfamily)